MKTNKTKDKINFGDAVQLKDDSYIDKVPYYNLFQRIIRQLNRKLFGKIYKEDNLSIIGIAAINVAEDEKKGDEIYWHCCYKCSRR